MYKFTIVFILVCLMLGLSAQNYQIQKVVASDRDQLDFFGEAVAIDGDYAIVGSKYQDSDEGAAYIFKVNDEGVFEQTAILEAPDPYAGSYFGHSVAIYNKTAVVGAPLEAYDATGTNYMTEAGAIYIFTRGDGEEWSFWQKIVPADRDYLAQFGYSVALHGEHMVVSARSEKKDENGLNPITEAGAAYTLIRDGDLWVINQKIVASDRAEQDWFGEDLAIYGNTIVIGVPWEDEDASGGNTLDRSGSAYVFSFNTDDVWVEYQKIVLEDREKWDQFGFSVSIWDEQIAIGANFKDKPGAVNIIDAGSVYMYELNGSIWEQVDQLYSEDAYYFDEFGYSVSLNGNHLLVGAYSSDDYGQGTQEIFNAGAAYYFQNSKGSWSQVDKIVAPVRAEADNFGIDVFINSEGTGIIGAMREDEDQNEQNTIMDAGAAYFYKSGTSSIVKNDFPGKVSAYPNPAVDQLSLQFEKEYDLNIQIRDLMGRAIKTYQYAKASNISIELTSLPVGMYMLVIESENYRMIRKVLKK
ncbi:MAG: T9SS type A sorting domain-containing protein [Bacteroidales bacterium]|nr:T9SS type A sorting domain-containing protein [Bacteroidales bacterium]